MKGSMNARHYFIKGRGQRVEGIDPITVNPLPDCQGMSATIFLCSIIFLRCPRLHQPMVEVREIFLDALASPFE